MQELAILRAAMRVCGAVVEAAQCAADAAHARGDLAARERAMEAAVATAPAWDAATECLRAQRARDANAIARRLLRATATAARELEDLLAAAPPASDEAPQPPSGSAHDRR